MGKISVKVLYVGKADRKHLESNTGLLKHSSVWLKVIETFQL